MSDDSLPTLWEAEPHTLAKLGILEGYLKAWMPILSRHVANQPRGGRILYVDAFAGPGEYETGESGSPLVAVETATQHEADFPVPIELFFIEAREDRWKNLGELLERRRTGQQRNARIHPPILGEADPEIRRLLRDRRKDSYTPTLIFLDQFGYSGVSMELIRTILEAPSCELVEFMNWRDLNRFLGDETKWSGIDRAFGGQEWRKVLDVEEPLKRSQAYIESYDQALRERGGARYSWSFSMYDDANRPLCWLVFCSGSDRGLEEMKKAMRKVDPSGRYRFSDRSSGQIRLWQDFDQRWLAEHLATTFEGQVVNGPDLRHRVLTETPCHQCSEALGRLEKEERLTVVEAPPRRRRRAFKKYLEDPNFVIRFEEMRRAPEQGQLF